VAILLSLLAAVIVVDMTQVELERVEAVPDLPVPVTNNAVVSLEAGGREFLISFAGLGAEKEHDDTHARTFVFDSEAGEWIEAPAVPGGVGRLAAAAVAVGELAYVFGGYSVSGDGTEVSTPWVHAFDPLSGEFAELAPMPVPVDDAIAVVYADRYIYLVSGWHDFGNVNLVQRYDVVEDLWDQATPTPGRAVFGHAGGITGNKIVYCDGVAIEPHEDRRRDFVANAECFLGIIDADEPRRIDWREIEAHPGKPRYRMAAAGMTEEGGVIFVGGSDNPYNYDGMGYNGVPSSPMADAILYKVESGSWQEIDVSGPATMDHRGLVFFEGGWVTVGGMADDQQVTGDVNTYMLD
jgi:hypothetical protein